MHRSCCEGPRGPREPTTLDQYLCGPERDLAQQFCLGAGGASEEITAPNQNLGGPEYDLAQQFTLGAGEAFAGIDALQIMLGGPERDLAQRFPISAILYVSFFQADGPCFPADGPRNIHRRRSCSF